METKYDKAIEEERIRIARELHDGPLQIMTHIGHRIEYVQCLLAKEAIESAQSELLRVRTILETCLHALRYDISTLMTTQITPQNIGDSLQALLNAYQEREPISRLTYVLPRLEQLPAHITHPFFRFVQEALQNVHKHAQATEVALRVHLSTTSLLAEVCDNGIGLEAEEKFDKNNDLHIGMRIMRERVQEVGGTVEFASNRGKGTCVRAIFPLAVA